MSVADAPQLDETSLRDAVRSVCAGFDDGYWRELDAQHGYPDRFVAALTEAGFLAALIPEEYGGAGLGLDAAAIILEEINRSGGNAAVCHAQMYTMGTLLRHGSGEQKARYLPDIARGALRLQAFGVTEPGAGSDTTKIRTTAVRTGDRYRIDGQKVWMSRAEHSDLMILLARTTPLADVQRKSDGLSVFLVDMRGAVGNGITIRPIATMMNHATTEVFFDGLEIPADALIGEEGRGFRYILDGMNAERILIAAECVGDGRWFVERGARYAREREVFGRPIAANQGIAFPHERTSTSKRLTSCGATRRRSSWQRSRAARKPIWPSCSPPMHHGKRPTSACRRMGAMASPWSTTSNGSSARRGSTKSRPSRPT